MEQKPQIKAPEKASDHSLNAICIIPFETTLQHLYENDKDGLEQLMRTLIHLDSINVHLIIYTTVATRDTVLAILQEYGPSKYFLAEDDIFCLATMDDQIPAELSHADREYQLINLCINYHNRTRQDAVITSEMFQERVLVLHTDPNFLREIDKKKEGLHYMGIHIDHTINDYAVLLEKIYIIFRENGKSAKIQEASEMFRLAKAQDSEVVEDQKMMALLFQRRQLTISMGIAEGLAGFLKKLSKVIHYIKAFDRLTLDKQKTLVQNITSLLETRIRAETLSIDISEATIKELHEKLHNIKFSYSYDDLKVFQSIGAHLWFSLYQELDVQLAETLEIVKQNKLTYTELTPIILGSLCVEELNVIRKIIVGNYEEELKTSPWQTQKKETGEYYYMKIEGDKVQKQEIKKQAMKLYITLLYPHFKEEIKFLQNEATFEFLEQHYRNTLQKIDDENDRVRWQIGNREQEIKEERNANLAQAHIKKDEALFHSMFLDVRQKRMSRMSLARVDKDPFQLCRSGNVVSFIEEVSRQQSAPYNLEDIMFLLSWKSLTLKRGFKHLLIGQEGEVYPDHDNNKYYVLTASGIDNILAAANNKVFEEIAPLLPKSQELRIKILFPFCMKQLDNYWLTGEVKIHKVGHQYSGVVMLHGPCGTVINCEDMCKKWCDVLTKQISKIDPSATCQLIYSDSPYKPRLHKEDRANSSVMVVEDINSRIQGKILAPPKPKDESLKTNYATFYPKGVFEIRAEHTKLLVKQLDRNDVNLQLYLVRHPDINRVGEHKKTLFETAAQHGQVKMLGFLISEMFADGNFFRSGFHPVFSALLGVQHYPFRIDLLRFMLQGGTELGEKSSRRAMLDNKTVDVTGTPLLHFAVALGVDRAVETLVKWGVDNPGTVPLYPRNQKKRTALYEALCASRYGKLRGVIEVLLQYGLGLHADEVEKAKTDPLVKSDMIKVVITFIDNQLAMLYKLPSAPLPTRNRNGSFGAMGSVFSNIIRRVTYQWSSPLLQHCAENRTEKIITRPQIKSEESNIQAQLGFIDKQGFALIIPACVSGNIETLDFLLKYNVNVNIVTPNKIVRKIVGNDDAPELEIATHLTPLHYAILCQKDSHLFVKKLLEKYAHVIPDSTQCTPLYYAVGRNNESVRLLLEHLSDNGKLEVARIFDKAGITPFVKAVLIADKTCISHFIHYGYWPSNNEILLIELEMVKKENCAEIKKIFCEVLELLKTRLVPGHSKELQSSQRLKPKALNLESPRLLQRSNSQPMPVRPTLSGVQSALSPRKVSDLPPGGTYMAVTPQKDIEPTSVASPRSGSEIVASARIDNEIPNVASPRSGSDIVSSPRANPMLANSRSNLNSMASPRNEAVMSDPSSPLKSSGVVNSVSQLRTSATVVPPRNNSSVINSVSSRHDTGTALQNSLRAGGIFQPAPVLNSTETSRAFSPRNGAVAERESPRDLSQSKAPLSSPKSAESVSSNSLRRGGDIASNISAELRPRRDG